MRCELLVPILLQSQVKLILKISLVYPELFDESMWRMLTREVLGADWDYYSFLPFFSGRRFAEIARRKCLLSVVCPTRQVYLAIFNGRRDILERCCREHPQESKTVFESSLSFDRLYFNRPLYNFIQERLFGRTLERLQLLERKIILTLESSYWEENYYTWTDRLCTAIMDTSYIRMYDLLQMHLLHTEQEDKISLREDNIQFWLTMYSRTQKKAMISSMIDFAKRENLALELRRILCNLYSSNHLDLAQKYQEKFGISLTSQEILNRLAIYYVNTGDDRGLYQTLSRLEIDDTVTRENHIFYFGLPEVDLLVKY